MAIGPCTDCSSTPQGSALNAASQTIRDGLNRLDKAAAGIVSDVSGQGGAGGDPGKLVSDILDLSQSALQVKAGVAVARTDQEVGNEIVNMVRHDADAQHARDTRPKPQRTLPQQVVDILA
jgi:hypothetical protein